MEIRNPVDELELTKHTAIGYTLNELAALTGASVDTLTRHYADAIKRGRELRNASLRRKQFELAMAGNAIMCIFLGKQYLDQKDKAETVSTVKIENADPTKLTDDQLAEAERIIETAYAEPDQG